MLKRLCLALAVLMCMASIAFAESEMPDRIGIVGIIEQLSDEGDSFCVRQPDGYTQEIHVTENTALNMEEALRDGLLVYVRFDASIKSAAFGREPVNAARIQNAMYDMYIGNENDGTNPAGAGGVYSGNPQILFPAGTDIKALVDKNIRFMPYTVEGAAFTELVEARKFEPVDIIGGVIESASGNTLQIAPYNAAWESVRILVTDETTFVYDMSPGMTVDVVYTELDDSASPPEVTALTIWVGFG